MRLVEFASAEEQIALWKLISDSVWQSLSAQQRQEAEQKQAQKLRKPKSAARKKPVAIPPSPPAPKPMPQAQPAQKNANPQQMRKQTNVNAAQTQRSAVPSTAYLQQPQNIATTKSTPQTALAGQKTLDMRGKVA